jgi:ABC-type nickel/cobalt efflux system permease component RcnA
MLSPGRGKAGVEAYLIGAHRTANHGAFLGLTMTVAHGGRFCAP